MTPRLMIMLAIAAALAGLVAWDASQRDAPPRPSSAPASAEMLAPALERPLFNPTRRPPSEIAAKPEAAAPVAQSFRLLGVAQADGVSVAVIEIDGQRARLKRGQTLAGWRVEAIGPRRAVLVNGETRRVLSF